MDLLIFSKAPSAYEPSRILVESINAGLKAAVVSYSSLDFTITPPEVAVSVEGRPLPAAKMVVFRAAGGENFYIPQRDYLVDLFVRQKAEVLNAKTYQRWPRLDKITQHFEFQKAGLPFVESKTYGDNERLLALERNYPYIIKESLSSRGREVFKPGNQRGMQAVFTKEHFVRSMLLQPFLRSGQDLRVIVIAGRAIGAMKRIAKPGKYLTNYSQGGLVENYDLAKDIKAQKIAESCARHFLLDYGGIDLMAGEDGKWKVLEVNRACQFQGFEKATGINVPKNVIKFLQRKK